MIRVEIDDVADFEAALARFQQMVRLEYERSWTKRRYGYYENSSALRRKRKKMRRLQARLTGTLWLRIDLAPQFARTGPINTAGR